MLILVGSEGNTLNSPIAKRFGHANYYILFNTDSQTFEAIPNIEEGHNHDNLIEFLNRGVEAFIVGNIGPQAFEVINTPRSKVFLARKMNMSEAIEKYVKGELQQLTEPTAPKSIRQGHGHSHRHIHKHK